VVVSYPLLSQASTQVEVELGCDNMKIPQKINIILPIPGEAKAKAMPGWLYIHTK
jgi:hypothetical protein